MGTAQGITLTGTSREGESISAAESAGSTVPPAMRPLRNSGSVGHAALTSVPRALPRGGAGLPTLRE